MFHPSSYAAIRATGRCVVLIVAAAVVVAIVCYRRRFRRCFRRCYRRHYCREEESRQTPFSIGPTPTYRPTGTSVFVVVNNKKSFPAYVISPLPRADVAHHGRHGPCRGVFEGRPGHGHASAAGEPGGAVRQSGVYTESRNTADMQILMGIF